MYCATREWSRSSNGISSKFLLKANRIEYNIFLVTVSYYRWGAASRSDIESKTHSFQLKDSRMSNIRLFTLLEQTILSSLAFDP
mmetsp:Transcript_14548/g.25217  ORF Transcript_14548/g.25217 Transcript_14548/m.25217 type:complete len:84 (-) Transcript_14548:462-713(-)